MSLVVVGMSHHTSPVEVRERLAFSLDAMPGALMRLKKRLAGGGAVILSTCNRVELYANHVLEPELLRRELRHFLSEQHNVPLEEFRDFLYEYADREAVGHLFRVAASLDSLVIGEGQIAGQVRDAYLLAQAEQAADKIIHMLFQKALSVAKCARTRTAINEGKVSVGSVAVDLAHTIFTDLSDKTVAVVGSGEMGELVLTSLLSQGVGRVLVANRSAERAAAVARTYHGEPIPFEELADHLHAADIVISSTAAPGFVLFQDHFTQALRRRDQAPMFVIDIAVPRDVDPAVGALDNVYLYNLDDLQQVVEQNLEARRTAMEQCMEIIERGVEQFMQWHRGLVAQPTIVSMAEELNAIRERELQKTLAALPELNDKERQEVVYLTERILKHILQRPMTEIRHELDHHDPSIVLHLARRLFGLEEGK